MKTYNVKLSERELRDIVTALNMLVRENITWAEENDYDSNIIEIAEEQNALAGRLLDILI